MVNGIIDFHSHILPGVDDGSASVEESIAMLRMEAEQGIDQVVATPHFYPQHDTPERFLQRRKKAEETLLEALQKHPGLPKLEVGAEVYYYPGISGSNAIFDLSVERKRCVIIEMPPPPWTDAMYRELEGVYRNHGLIPIVAHVDRYIGRFRNYGIPARLAELPVLVQANASFFLDKGSVSTALRMLKKGEIHLLGSDCHGVSSRSPNLGAALDVIRAKLGESSLEAIRENQRRALLEDPLRVQSRSLYEFI